MKSLLPICLVLLCIIPQNSNAQDWKLLNILGSSDQLPADNLGISVDISDSLIIAGAFGSEGNSGINNSGAAYLYRLSTNGNFTEIASIYSTHPESLGYFGHRVAISGRNILIGAFNEDHSGLGNAGRVYAYTLNNEDELMLMDTITINSNENADYFGFDISMIDNYAVIGAYRYPLDENNENSLKEAGGAFLYKRNQDGKWQLIKTIVAPDRESEDNFGRHVSMDESGIIISAFNKKSSNSVSEAGVIYAIKCDGDCNFDDTQGAETIQIEASGPVSGQQFGWDVGISGNWIAAAKRRASRLPDGNIIGNTGSVYFFKWENGAWIEKQEVFADDYMGQAYFGERIALEGGICVIGAGGESYDEAGENFERSSGAAYVFELNEDEVWIQKQKLVGIGRSTDDLYANEGLAIDKKRLVVGSWRADTIDAEELIDGGVVYVYEREGDLPSMVENIDLKEKIDLFNNPSDGLIIFSFNGEFKGLLSVYSLNGSKVHGQKIIINHREIVDLSHLSQGIYCISVFNENGSQSYKWVKM